MNAAWWLLLLAVASLALVAFGAGWIGYGAGYDRAQAEAADQAEAELADRGGQAADVDPWPRVMLPRLGSYLRVESAERWRVPDQLGAELPEGAPWACPGPARALPWIVGPRAHNVPELAHQWAPYERPDAAEPRPVTSPADLDLDVRRMCEETARYVQNLIDQHRETP